MFKEKFQGRIQHEHDVYNLQNSSFFQYVDQSECIQSVYFTIGRDTWLESREL